MTEAYLDGSTTLFRIDEHNQGGQTFIPVADHMLHTIDIDLQVGLFTPPVFVRIYNADANFWPVGDPIQFNKIDPQPTFPPRITRHRIECKTPVLLHKGMRYALVCFQGHILLGTRAQWAYHLTDSKYFRGHRIHSIDDGGTWTVHYTQDHMFAEIGDPYSPPPPPPPPISNWFISQIWYYTSLNGMVIVVATNTPCHMYMYYTKEPPQKHVVPRLRRGTPFSDILNYCFVAWHENEQEEPGDTLLHTFIKSNWPVCETRWFTFRANVEFEWSSSIGPIFEKHRLEDMAPLTFGPVLAQANNRTITKSALLWPSCHDAPAGTIVNWHDPPFTYLSTRTAYPVLYHVDRSFLSFDTSGIPTGSLITGAVLSIFLQRKWASYDPTYPNVCITQGVQQDPVIATDYGAQLPYTTIGAQRDINTMVINQYNDVIFNAAGLPWINPAGVTKLCIRQQMDILNLTFPVGTHRIYYYSAQKGNGFHALLTVYYVPP